MQIKKNLLLNTDGTQVNFKATPNKGGIYTPQYLVIHYTAVTTFESTLNHFQSPNAKASAHLLIGRRGEIAQFAPFNIVAFHAGKSQWKGLVGLNQFSIGIELVNAGRLIKSGNTWTCPVDLKKVPNTAVIMATHKNETIESAWQQYTKAQLEVAIEIAGLLVTTYGLKDVVGHEDISPIRKSDPGPAFPMGSFRSRAMGRQDESLDEFFTSAEVNIRSGPGTNFNTLTQAMPKGTHVLVLKTEGTWSFVEVLDTVHGIMDLEGWVSSKFLIN
ncbi:MAG: N-acetylmuramoyl-L-alanine amidase [Chitinophagaceae bacterium]